MNRSIKKTSVCIVGGGPGGVATSGYLTKAKIPHILIEAKNFPRNKPCADTISIHVLKYIEYLFPKAYNRIKSEAKLDVIRGLNVFAPNNALLEFEYPDLAHFNGEPSSYTIRRDRLDNYLFEALKDEELCDAYEGIKVDKINTDEQSALVITKEFDVSCDLVIVASGCNSKLAATITGNQKEEKHFAMGIRGYFENVKVDQLTHSELYLNYNTFLGGFYISPLGNNLFNVNMVMKKGSVNYHNLNFREHFFNHIKTHPILKDKFKDAKLIEKVEGHGLLLGTKNRKVSDNRVLFVGDAAGIIDIVTANGIPQAFKSAKVATTIAVQALKVKNYSAAFLKSYDKQLYKTLKKDLRTGRVFTKIYRTDWSYKIALRSANFSFKTGIISKLLSLGIYGFNPKKKTK